MKSDVVTPKMIESQSNGNSIVQIILNDNLIGYISLIDKLRPNVKEMVMKLKKENIIFFLQVITMQQPLRIAGLLLYALPVHTLSNFKKAWYGGIMDGR